MKEIFLEIKRMFTGKWSGEGFARFPTIDDTAYTEQLEFIPDQYKDAIFFNQKTWYKNNTAKNGHTVFWDSGFIILKSDEILLHSVQIGGRMETLELFYAVDQTFRFNSTSVLHDAKAIQSQRIFIVSENNFHYELNMATHEAIFQNHLSADLKKVQ